MPKFITYTCLQCNKTETDYLRGKKAETGRKFCSTECYWAFRKADPPVFLNCEACGKSFERNAIHARRVKKHFCSAECCKAARGRIRNHRHFEDWVCDECGKTHRAGVFRCASCALKRQHRVLKAVVFDHYGRRCVCCNEKQFEFLSIDHKNGQGAEQRRAFFARTGQQMVGCVFYRWIIKQGFPDDLQILCMNCNSAKGWYGKCPHENEQDISVASGV